MSVETQFRGEEAQVEDPMPIEPPLDDDRPFIETPIARKVIAGVGLMALVIVTPFPYLIVSILAAALAGVAAHFVPAITASFPRPRILALVLMGLLVLSLGRWLIEPKAHDAKMAAASNKPLETDSDPIIGALMKNMPGSIRENLTQFADTDESVPPDVRASVDRYGKETAKAATLDGTALGGSLAQVLDDHPMHDMTLTGMTLIYRGGPLDLENVQVIHCKTNFSEAPKLRRFMLNELVMGKIHTLCFK